MSFSVSARGKDPLQSIAAFIESLGDAVDSIDSIFGFVQDRSHFYGGRNFFVNPWQHRKRVPELSEKNVLEMYELGIGLRLPLQNYYAARDEFDDPRERAFLDKYHRVGNTLIVANDELAGWLRKSYPNYRLEASVIKDLDTKEAVQKALALYDTVVPAFSMHEDLEVLESLENKDKIRLFANVSCERYCPARICYRYFSKINKNPVGASTAGKSCSSTLVDRKRMGFSSYDVEGFRGLGFTKFKLLRERLDRPGQAY